MKVIVMICFADYVISQTNFNFILFFVVSY